MALRFGGGRARSMGAGVYLFIPVFYTDPTESYRLGRAAHVRTDLGGL
jgi:putative peptide zinc metalloprotease protein